MTTSHGRRIQGRRALAIMAWVSLVIVAGLLWYGQEEDIIRIQAWEPAALLLSAYSAFLAIFGWLLFAPQRKSAEESPALFFSGILTLIPPCFIAYHLMPPSSPLRGWLTIGVFVFGLLSILSPLPAEVFAVPRDRKSYLQPLTDCYLSVLDVEEPTLDLQSLVPRSYYTLTGPEVAPPKSAPEGSARDPWQDPFYGTGRSMSQVGSARRSTYSESRTRSSETRSESVFRESPLREPLYRETQRDVSPRESDIREDSQRPDRSRALPQSREGQHSPVRGYQSSPAIAPPVPQSPPPIPVEPVVSGFTRPPMTARSAFAPRESRAPNYRPPSAAPETPDRSTAVPVPQEPVEKSASVPVARRPLTEPGGRTTQPVGFQTPPASRPVTSSPPPVPTFLAPAADRSAVPVPPVARELSARPATRMPDTGPGSGLGAIPAVAPLASAATYDDVLKSAVSEFRSLSDPAPPVAKTPGASRPLLDSDAQSLPTRQASVSSARVAETNIRELDRRIQELEAESEQDETTESLLSSPAGTSVRNDIQMERQKDEHGGEMIEGTIRVFFDVGQKRAHLHVPLSPPLAGLPEVECEAVSDDSVRCKVAVRQPYGIRIEARRSEASQELTTEIGFAAVYTPPAKRG
ncbi:MAG: hypothetical protein R3C17_04445 [Planctomycetaceae bacterium]